MSFEDAQRNIDEVTDSVTKAGDSSAVASAADEVAAAAADRASDAQADADAAKEAAGKINEQASADADEARHGLAGLVDKAKEYLSDDKVDELAEKIKGLTPDSVDQYVDKAADQAKKYND